MNLFGRGTRRSEDWASPHERARTRAAQRLDWPLDPAEAVWLDGHLTDCKPCRRRAAEYQDNRDRLRTLRAMSPATRLYAAGGVRDTEDLRALIALGCAGVLVASYPVLLVFLGVNLRVPGFAVIFVGLALNLAVIAPNGGMPVSPSALRAAGGSAADIRELETSDDVKHHVRTEEDVFAVIGDTIPVPLLKIVVSPGDLLAYAGVGWTVIAVMLRREPMPMDLRTKRRRPSGYRGKHRPGVFPAVGRKRRAAKPPVPAAATRSGTAQ